jgi:hypothetical protein
VNWHVLLHTRREKAKPFDEVICSAAISSVTDGKKNIKEQKKPRIV